MPELAQVANLLAINFGLLLAGFLVLWLIGVAIRDVTFVDACWGLGLASLALMTFVQTAGGEQSRRWLLTGLALAWGLRLGGHILGRWRHEGPDRRYVKMMERAKSDKGWSYAYASLRLVFAFQAPLLWVVALPVQLGQIAAQPQAIGLLGWVGAALSVFGIVFETTADSQLKRFKADPANKGQVLATGLWRYTRHPNYFGDICVWCGLYLIAAESQLGLWALPGPLLLIFLLTRWSGGPSYEKRLTHQRPGYDEYIRRTSSLIPWPPKPAERNAP
jgi:steroid 5-alpha reductase family enzyme